MGGLARLAGLVGPAGALVGAAPERVPATIFQLKIRPQGGSGRAAPERLTTAPAADMKYPE